MPSTDEKIQTLVADLRPRERPHFDLRAVAFEQQLPFCLDKSRQQTAVCTRRAGKTYACAAKLLDTALSKPGCVALYITLSRLNAKRIVWGTLKELNAKFNLGGEVSEGELRISFPNAARVYLSGASDASEVDKFRGLPIGVALVDEAQSFPLYLKKMLDEVLAPALMDYDGAIVLVGTPGPVPKGYYYDCVESPDWSHHGWTAFDNPHIERKSGKNAHQLLAEELQRRGVGEGDPVIQREYFGRWVLDANALVFRYDPAKNSGASHKKLTDYVFGVDLGFDDADAIAVLGWNSTSPALYLVEESVIPKQNITALMDKLVPLYEQYKPQAVVCDMGGLGKKIAEEITSRPPNIPLEAAEKTEKNANIELLNDALRTGRLFAPKASRFAQDCMLVEWDKSNAEKWKINERFHSDICDAVLYAYRKAQHWLYQEPPAPKPEINSPGWLEAEKRKLEEQWETQLEQNRREQRGEAFGGGDDGMGGMERWV